MSQMLQREIGTTGRMASAVGLGTWAIGGWMWGVVGALIGVPLLVVIKVFCDHFEGLSKFGEFLSGEAEEEAPATNGSVGAENPGAPPRTTGSAGA